MGIGSAGDSAVLLELPYSRFESAGLICYVMSEDIFYKWETGFFPT